MKNLFSYIKMGKEILTFGDIESKIKIKNYRHKTPMYLRDVDIKKVLYQDSFW